MHSTYMPNTAEDQNRYSRLREPSTWAGVAVLVGSIFPAFGDAAVSVADAVPSVLGAAAAVVAVFKREGGR